MHSLYIYSLDVCPSILPNGNAKVYLGFQSSNSTPSTLMQSSLVFLTRMTLVLCLLINKPVLADHLVTTSQDILDCISWHMCEMLDYIICKVQINQLRPKCQLKSQILTLLSCTFIQSTANRNSFPISTKGAQISAFSVKIHL